MLQSQRAQIWGKNCEDDDIKSHIITNKQVNQDELTLGSPQKCQLAGVKEFI